MRSAQRDEELIPLQFEPAAPADKITYTGIENFLGANCHPIRFPKIIMVLG